MNKTGFLTPLQVESVDAKTWKLLTDLVWIGSQGDAFKVEAGDKTDFATVPWWTQSLIPRTGTWTKAAVLHDKMCDNLNAYHHAMGDYRIFYKDWCRSVIDGSEPWAPKKPEPPVFNSVDTDFIFRKNAKAGGTGFLKCELLWLGVRCGALANGARRAGWMSTFPRFLGGLVAITGLLGVFFYALYYLLSLI